MNSKIGCLSGWKFALVTLVEFLSTIYLVMLFQIRCFRCWKIALVTFLGFSSTMYLHMIVSICCEWYWKIALITFIGLFSTVCPHANPIAKCHSFFYLLMSTLADNSLNEFPKENLLKPCTLCAYQGPANSKGKLHSFLQLIILQHGSRFPTHHRFKSTWIRRFQPSLFFPQNGIQFQLCLTQHARQRQTLFIATQRQTLSAVDQWQTLLFDT